MNGQPSFDFVADQLRHESRHWCESYSIEDTIDIVCRWAGQWDSKRSDWYLALEHSGGPFPVAHVLISLSGITESLTRDTLRNLFTRDEIYVRPAGKVIGHVIAANTPLLSWVSCLRCLLLGMGSLIKVPSGPSAAYAYLFKRTIHDVSPDLARLIEIGAWKGGDTAIESKFVSTMDKLVVYGSDRTIEHYRALSPAAMLGYGHRTSYAVFFGDSAPDADIDGVIQDVVLFDQGGCLSPQALFVIGTPEHADVLAARVHARFPAIVKRIGLVPRTLDALAVVREIRSLSSMDANARVLTLADDSWTIILRESDGVPPTITHGVLFVQSVPSLADLERMITSRALPVQGICFSDCYSSESADIVTFANHIGASFLAAPGSLQRPPFRWTQDNYPVLRALLP